MTDESAELLADMMNHIIGVTGAREGSDSAELVERAQAALARSESLDREVEGTADGLPRVLRRAYVEHNGNWQKVASAAREALSLFRDGGGDAA